MPGRAYNAMPSAAIAGPTVSGRRLPTRATSPPDHRDNANMISGSGSSAAPGLGGRVALHLNEIHRDEEEDDRQRRVQEQRQDVREREGARPEKTKRQHRVRRARRSTTTNSAQRHAFRSPAPTITRGWLAPSGGHSSRSEDDAAQAEDRQAGAGPVDPGRPRRIAALVHEPERQHEHDHRERHVQEEHGAPADVFDQPAAGDRADRRRDGAEARPGPDRPPAFGIVKGGADDGEAARDEEGGADSLQRAARRSARWRTWRGRRKSTRR